MRLKRGTRLLVLEDLSLQGQTYWQGAYTGGFRYSVPKGTILVSLKDMGAVTLGIQCVPENEEDFEERFVLAEDRGSAGYAGYSLFLWRWQLGRAVRILE